MRQVGLARHLGEAMCVEGFGVVGGDGKVWLRVMVESSVILRQKSLQEEPEWLVPECSNLGGMNPFPGWRRIRQAL